MNAAKGGKASVRSPKHYPIEKARAVHEGRVAVRREPREAQEQGRPPKQHQRFLLLD
jgi:hypothetical protein